ncbi:MAG: ATP-binding protein [Candidatus Omnitrophota bacterium]
MKTPEKKQLEEEISYLKERLAESAKLNIVGEVTGGLIHDIRNSLAVIIQGVYLLNRRIDSKDAAVLKTMETIGKGAYRADGLLGMLADFTKKCDFKICDENIIEIIEDAIKIFKLKYKFVGIKFDKQIPESLTEISVDRGRMAHVLVNLLLNAAESISGKGDLTIRVSESSVSDIKKKFPDMQENDFNIFEDGLVCIEIEDDGIGISKSHLSQMFDPFFTTKTNDITAGAGLAVSRYIVELHKGLILAESELGKGTKITVVLNKKKG